MFFKEQMAKAGPQKTPTFKAGTSQEIIKSWSQCAQTSLEIWTGNHPWWQCGYLSTDRGNFSSGEAAMLGSLRLPDDTWTPSAVSTMGPKPRHSPPQPLSPCSISGFDQQGQTSVSSTKMEGKRDSTTMQHTRLLWAPPRAQVKQRAGSPSHKWQTNTEDFCSGCRQPCIHDLRVLAKPWLPSDKAAGRAGVGHGLWAFCNPQWCGWWIALWSPQSQLQRLQTGGWALRAERWL